MAGCFISTINRKPKDREYMKSQITLPVAELKEALPGLTKVIGKSRTLPALQTVRVTRNQEGIVTLHATDLDSFVTYTTKAPQQGSPADVLVPVDQLTKATKCSAPKEEIGIIPEAKDKVRLRYNIAGNIVEQTITTLPVDEFPPTPQVNQPGIQVEPQFGKALKEALACCSEDASRYVLRGACLDVTDKKFHYIVGTDGRSLFSANSFTFDLQKSVIIPDSKFLNWSDLMEQQPASLSVEPGEEAQEAKDGQPAKGGKAAYVKLESPRWKFITKEIEGKFPNWRQCVPTPTSKWTQVVLSEEAVKQLIQVVPNLPGADLSNAAIRLQVDGNLVVEGQGKEDEKWTGVPIQPVSIVGGPVAIALNRHYLLKGLRFGLNKLEIENSLSPLLMSNGGKKLVIMPVRMEGATPTPEPAKEHSPQPTTEERNEMPRTASTTEPEPVETETRAPEKPEVEIPRTNGNGSGVKSLVDHVEQIKDSLKAVIRDLASVIDMVKAAEKEKRTTEKEVEAIRTKLRQIQSVSI
jgi:DNA polymerase III sliding clamp (beta) subunit (PCNA family)